MKSFYCLLFLPLITCLSCQNKQTTHSSAETLPVELSSTQIDSLLINYIFQYENPILVDSNKQILIPLSTRKVRGKSLPRIDMDVYSKREETRYWNVLFHHLGTGKTNLLTEDKYSISQIYTKKAATNQITPFVEGKILYKIQDTDLNSDGILNHEDPTYLYASNEDGTDLQRISPDSETLLSFQILPNQAGLILKTLRDIDQDAVFNSKDETIWYKATQSANAWKVTEMIDTNMRNQIKEQYLKHWILRKE